LTLSDGRRKKHRGDMQSTLFIDPNQKSNVNEEEPETQCRRSWVCGRIPKQVFRQIWAI